MALVPIASVAQALPVQLGIEFPASNLQCEAAAAAFTIRNPARFTWRCSNAFTNFRCNLRSAAVYNPGTGIVAVACSIPTEVPVSGAADLLFASSNE